MGHIIILSCSNFSVCSFYRRYRRYLPESEDCIQNYVQNQCVVQSNQLMDIVDTVDRNTSESVKVCRVIGLNLINLYFTEIAKISVCLTTL